MRGLKWCRALILATYAVFAFTSGANASPVADLVKVALGKSDSELTYQQAKLAFDRIIDPAADQSAISAQIAAFAESARSLAPGGTDIDKLRAIRQVLYDPGSWNDNRPFTFDLADPFGRDLNNKLLATYLRTRKGNCVSMPILHLLVAEQLGLNVSLSTAPQHLFLRYTNPANGRSIAIEATSGGHPARDVWYRQQMGVTDAQVASGIHMALLNRRETGAVMASTVTEWLMREKRWQEAIALTDVVLAIYPKDIHSLVISGAAYGELMRAEFMARYPQPALIPRPLLERMQFLESQNEAAQAEAWGWRQAGP